MNNVNENVVVVFKDAADYENRITRQKAFKDATRPPYVIIVSEEFGKAPDTAVLAPDDVRMKIMEQSPEPFSTWLRTDNGKWVNIKPTEPDDLYNRVFKSAFFDRVEKLAYLLQALGCKEYKVEANETNGDHTIGKMTMTEQGSAEGSVGKVNGKVNVDTAFTVEDVNDLTRKLSVKLGAKFEKHDDFDVEYVTELMRKYGFDQDMKLIAIRDAKEHGRSPTKEYTYIFDATFTEEIKTQIDSAFRMAINISRLPVGGELETKFNALVKKHRQICQSLVIKINN